MSTVVIKTIFLQYILLPLAVILLAAVLGYMKKHIPKIKGKVLIVYILLAGLCLAVPGFLGFSGNMFNPFYYLLSMAVYLLLGILHVSLVSYYFNFEGSERPQWFIMLFESMVTITCMLFGGYLFYLVFDWISAYKGYALMAATSVTVFIVPLSFYYCYIRYISIPFEIHKTWQHVPNSAIVDFDKIEFKALLLLNLELTKTLADRQKSRIDAKAPSDGVSVGEWFYRVVMDYNHKFPNSAIHLSNPEQDPYSWIFYTKKSIFHFRRFIDFDKTMSENNITERTTIICKRVINNEMEDKNNTKVKQ